MTRESSPEIEKKLAEFRRPMTVGEVAARAGVAVSTLHFYESEGLITSWRNSGNQRRYAREVLRHRLKSLARPRFRRHRGEGMQNRVRAGMAHRLWE